MNKEDLQERLNLLALRIFKLVDHIPNTLSGQTIARQIVRSGTSPSANYRAACLGKSLKDFLNKLKMVEEELDETNHWLYLLIRSNMIDCSRLQPLFTESQELCNIISKSIITVKKKLAADSNDSRD